jgi:HlyD family secretion protein
LAIWYLARAEPLLVQGEAESTRIDIAARVSGRLAKIAVSRGQNIAPGTTLLVIDNPELTAELRESAHDLPSLSEDFVFLRADGVTAGRLAHLKNYRIAAALG